MSELRHKNCGGKVRKTPEKFLSERLKKKGLTYLCFDCLMPISSYAVEENEK